MSEMSINAQFTADTKNLEAGIKKAQSALTSFGKTLSNATGKLNKGLEGWGISFTQFYDKGSSVLKNFGIDVDKFAAKLGMSGPLVAGITAATVALTKFGQEINKGRAQLAKGTGATGEQLIQLQNTLHKTMLVVGRDAEETGAIMANLNTRFGVTGEELTDLTVQFDLFSQATGEDAASSVNNIADVMAKWGIEQKDAAMLLDQLTKAGQDSGISIQTLTTNLKQNRTVFAQFGMSATQSIGFMESLAKNGIDTATAMQGMKYALTQFNEAGLNSEKALQIIAESIQNAENESEALNIAIANFGSKAGPEMVNVFKNGTADIAQFTENLYNAGGATEATAEAARTSKDAIGDLMSVLSGTFAGFGEGFDELVKNIVDTLSNIIRFVSPLIEPLGNVFKDLLSTVSSIVYQLISLFTEFVKKNSTAWNSVCLAVQSAYEILHRIFGNLEKVFKDIFGFIFAILEGKWGLAWEYAKNAFFRVIDNIVGTLSDFMNYFVNCINVIIDKVNEAIKKAKQHEWITNALEKVGIKLKEVDNIKPINLSDKLGLTKLIKESDSVIAKATAKATQTIETNLGKVEEVSSDVAKEVQNKTKETANDGIAWSIKLLQQDIDRLNHEKENAIIRAQNAKASEKEIADINIYYQQKIIAIQIQRLNLEKKQALEAETDAKIRGEIEVYYANLIEQLEWEKETKIREEKIKTGEWDKKLKEQKLSNIEKEKEKELKLAKIRKATPQEVSEIEKRYNEKIRALKLELLELERQAALEGIKDANEKATAEEYYNEKKKQILAEGAAEEQEQRDRSVEEEQSKWDRFKAMIAPYVNGVINAVKKTTAVMTKLTKAFVSTFKTLFSTVGKFATNAFKGIAKGLKKAFDFNPDEALNAILEFEDKIITFFTQTLPKLPKFFESVMSSIVHLVDSLIKNINMDELAKIIESILTTIVTYLPEIIAKAIPLIVRLVETICTTLVKNAPKIVNAISQILQAIAKAIPQLLPQIVSLVVALFEGIAQVLTDNAQIIVEAIGSVIMAIINNLPRILKALVSAILTLIKEIAAYIVNNQDQIAQDFSDIVKAIVDSISEFVQNGGWKKLLEAIVAIVKAINKALIDNLPSIVDTIEEMLPDLVDAIIEIIVEINKASSKLMPHLMRLVFAIIRAILDIISDQEVIETSLDVLVDLVEQLIYQLVQNLPIFIPLIVKGILTLIGGIVRRIPEFVVAIVKGLVKAFKDMDWKKLVKECFKAFVDGIKGFFGIHSPSTMFQQFGIYMVQGLVNGLKNIWGNVSGIFSNLANNIGSFFTNLFSSVSSWVGKIGSKMSEIGSGVWDNISGFFGSLGSNISNALSSIFSSVSSWVGKIGSKISEIGSGIGSVVSSVGSKIGSGIGSAVSSVGSAVSSIGSKLKFWATGTENAPRGLSIVGEAGPELVDFRGGEKVYNAHNTEKMLAGGSKTNTFNVTFNNTSQTTAFTVMREMKRYSREMAFNGVL